MVIGGMAGAFFLDKPPGAWAKIGIAIAGLVLGGLCYSLASNMLTYLHTVHEDPRSRGWPLNLLHRMQKWNIPRMLDTGDSLVTCPVDRPAPRISAAGSTRGVARVHHVRS
jgi:hypothetical protein